MRVWLLLALLVLPLAGCASEDTVVAPLELTSSRGTRPAEWSPLRLAAAGVRAAPPRGVPAPPAPAVAEEARLLDALAFRLDDPAQVHQLRAWRSAWYPDAPVADAAGVRIFLVATGLARESQTHSPEVERLQEAVAIAYRLYEVTERPMLRRAAQVVAQRASPRLAELQTLETAERTIP